MTTTEQMQRISAKFAPDEATRLADRARASDRTVSQFIRGDIIPRARKRLADQQAGRVTVPEPRMYASTVVSARLPVEDVELLQDVAAGERMTLSALLRRLAVEATTEVDHAG